MMAKWGVWACILCWLAVAASWSHAEPPSLDAKPPVRVETKHQPPPLSELPIDKLKGSVRDRAIAILKSPQFYRKGPVELFPCEPKLLEWLFEHPCWVSEFWRQMGMPVGPVEMTKDGYICLEERGNARFHVLYRAPELRILYCKIESKPALCPITLAAEMVIVQRYKFSKNIDGNYYAMQQLEGYVSAPGKTVRMVMKLTKGTSEQIIDRSLSDLMVYFSLMCRVLQVRPEWAKTTIAKVKANKPAGEAEELNQLVAVAASQSPVRELSRFTGADSTLPPVNVSNLPPSIDSRLR